MFAAGIAAIAPSYEKYTKLSPKERLKEATFGLLVLLFFVTGTTSEKPVAAPKLIVEIYLSISRIVFLIISTASINCFSVITNGGAKRIM